MDCRCILEITKLLELAEPELKSHITVIYIMFPTHTKCTKMQLFPFTVKKLKSNITTLQSIQEERKTITYSFTTLYSIIFVLVWVCLYPAFSLAIIPQAFSTLVVIIDIIYETTQSFYS